MRQPLEINAPVPPPVSVLSVSPLADDFLTLKAIVGHSRWSLFQADTFPGALTFLREKPVSVVLCERDLPPQTWIDLYQNLQNLSTPPCLIVTSRLADERLWAEALNLGAWDVLAKPFERSEVLRTVKSAWQHWYDRASRPPAALVRRAAS